MSINQLNSEQFYVSGDKITKIKLNDTYYRFETSNDFINIESYGAVGWVAGDSEDIKKQKALKNRAAFISAIEKAKELNKGIIIPNKTFYVDVTTGDATTAGGIIVEELNNSKIINYGEIFCLPNGNRSYATIFYFINCSNLIFEVGRLNSERTEKGTAPGGHTRVPVGMPTSEDSSEAGLSSNITAIDIQHCDNLIIKNGIITNMEYAVHIPRPRGITASNFDSKASENIVIDNLNISSTSQPFLINTTKNIIIKNCNVDSCALMGTGDHHIYVCDFVNYIRIEDCVFNFVDNYYGPALNFFNSYLGPNNHDGWSVKQAEVINCRVTNARYQRIVTGNGDSEIIIDGCDFRYLDTGNGFSTDIDNAITNWETRYEHWINYFIEKNNNETNENKKLQNFPVTRDMMEGRRGVFNIGSANCKLSVIVRNTSIIDPVNCGQLVSGWVYPWSLSFKNCNIKLGFLASYTTTIPPGGLVNNPSLTLSNCDITVRRWLLILKSFASTYTNTSGNIVFGTPSKVLLLNSKINCPFNTGVNPLVVNSAATPLISMYKKDNFPADAKLLSSLKILNCVINGHENNVFSDALNSSCVVANSIIEGFNNNIFKDISIPKEGGGEEILTFEGKCYNNYINGEYCDFKNIINIQSSQENGTTDNQSNQENGTTNDQSNQDSGA